MVGQIRRVADLGCHELPLSGYVHLWVWMDVYLDEHRYAGGTGRQGCDVWWRSFHDAGHDDGKICGWV